MTFCSEGNQFFLKNSDAYTGHSNLTQLLGEKKTRKCTQKSAAKIVCTDNLTALQYVQLYTHTCMFNTKDRLGTFEANCEK
jgi:hypothetical protein